MGRFDPDGVGAGSRGLTYDDGQADGRWECRERFPIDVIRQDGFENFLSRVVRPGLILLSILCGIGFLRHTNLLNAKNVKHHRGFSRHVRQVWLRTRGHCLSRRYLDNQENSKTAFLFVTVVGAQEIVRLSMDRNSLCRLPDSRGRSAYDSFPRKKRPLKGGAIQYRSRQNRSTTISLTLISALLPMIRRRARPPNEGWHPLRR